MVNFWFKKGIRSTIVKFSDEFYIQWFEKGNQIIDISNMSIEHQETERKRDQMYRYIRPIERYVCKLELESDSMRHSRRVVLEKF